MKRKSRYRTGVLTLAVLLCAVFLLMYIPSIAVMNLDSDGSLEVKLSNSEVSGLSQNDVVVDLYQVASLEKSEDSSVDFSYSMKDPYGSLTFPAANETMSVAQLNDFQQQAAQLTLTGNEEATKANVLPVVSGASPNTKIDKIAGETPLKLGVYLVIAHGKDLQKYDYNLSTSEGGEKLVTIARSESKEFYFDPQLVFLTGNVQVMDDAVSSNVLNYDKTIYLKLVQDSIKGGLKITKTLTGLDGGFYTRTAPVTFEFLIKEKGKDDSSGILKTITFHYGDPLEQSIIIQDEFPVETEVEVKERTTSINGFSIDGDASTIVNIGSDKENAVEVKFINKYSPGNSGGGSSNNYSLTIDNEFVYSEDGGWTWVLPEEE